VKCQGSLNKQLACLSRKWFLIRPLPWWASLHSVTTFPTEECCYKIISINFYSFSDSLSSLTYPSRLLRPHPLSKLSASSHLILLVYHIALIWNLPTYCGRHVTVPAVPTDPSKGTQQDILPPPLLAPRKHWYSRNFRRHWSLNNIINMDLKWICWLEELGREEMDESRWSICSHTMDD